MLAPYSLQSRSAGAWHNTARLYLEAGDRSELFFQGGLCSWLFTSCPREVEPGV